MLLCRRRRRRRRRRQRDRLGTVLGGRSFIAGPTVPGCLAAAGNILLIGTSFADAGAAGSEGDYFLYQKLSSTGEHLKYGITTYPATRYTSAETNGGRLYILASGTKQEMLALRALSLHEALPIGPEEGQTYYIQIQVAKGLHPLPPYDRSAQVRYILVLQWPGDSEADFDALISMEDRVETGLGPYASVDGHDFGSGEMNIFVETDRPTEAFADAAKALGESPRWGDLRAAYREARGGPYEILWPPGLREFSVK